jgi:glycosyltransferase involved in cell wall biosynthesis
MRNIEFWTSEGPYQGMKVLHLATSLRGGAGSAAVRIREAQEKFGIDATLTSRTQELRPDGVVLNSDLSFSTRLASSSLTLFQAKFVQNSKELVTPMTLSTIKFNNLAINEYDLINIHATYNFLNSFDLKRISDLRKPIVITLHDQRMFTGGCHYSGTCRQFTNKCQDCNLVRPLFRNLVSHAHKKQRINTEGIESLTFVSPSVWLAKQLQESSLGRGRSVVVINNPIPEKYFQAEIPSRVRKSKRVGFISANLNNPYKGLEFLVKALDEKTVERANIESLNLIGSGAVPPHSANLRIIQKIVQNDEAMIEILQQLDLLIVPSHQDNSPSVIGEALSLGVPVIGSRVGGIPEILQKFNLSTFIDKDPVSFKASITQSMSEQDRQLIRGKARQYFGENHVASEYFKVYQELILRG